MAGRHTNSAEPSGRSGSGWDWRGIVLPVAVVLAVLVGAVALANLNSPAKHAQGASGTGRSASNGSTSPGSSSTSGSNAAGQPNAAGQFKAAGQSDALAGCVRLFQKQLAATQAANASLDQWKLHIQAMNRLVAGLITLPQASKFWAQTRMGAMHKVQAFQRLRSQLHGMSCRGGASSDPQTQACRRATAAYSDVVHAARMTIHHWNMHIRQMEGLRTGRITPTQALQRWNHMWHLGQQQLRVYHRTLVKAQHQTCVA